MLVVVEAGLTEAGVRDVAARGWLTRRELGPTWALATTVDEVREHAARGANLWLRGLEAGGPVSATTALVLVRAAARTGRPWVAEGLGTRAMAAALACGAAGIVLDAHLWLTSESLLSEPERALVLAARSAVDTIVLGELDGRRVRTLVRGSRLAAPQHVREAARHAGRPVVEALEQIVAEVERLRALPPADLVPEPDRAVEASSVHRSRQLLAEGCPTLLLAGSEAGGRVGRVTSVGCWEEGLEALEESAGAHGVLAGGLGDPVAESFARVMAAGHAQRGGRLSLRLAIGAGPCRTTLVGSSLGAPLRCSEGPSASALRALEREWEAARWPRARREEAWPEALRAHPVEPADQGLELLDRPKTRAPGLTDRSGSFLPSTAALPLAGRASGASLGAVVRVAGAPSAPRRAGGADEGAVAVVGLGCVTPLGHDVPSFWTALLEGRSGIGPIPPERWSEARYHLPGAGAEGPARSSSRLAGAVRGFRFDPARYRIPPGLLRTVDPSQRLALVAADEAVRMAGWTSGIDKRRAAVVLGNSMGGEHSKSLALRVRFREVFDAVIRDDGFSGWSIEDLASLERAVEGRLAATLPPLEPDSMAGLLANVVAGRVAAWLDWMGGNLTVDAACASGLASLTVALDWLRLGRCDAVLAGGVDTDLAPETYVGFTRTLALSDTRSAPFSARADGFVMGEGAAVLALERLEDAKRAGRPVLAVIRGVGQASDGRGRGLTAPRAEGQALALERAWAEARRSPSDVGAVEAHGTGTPVGDKVEASVLVRHFARAEAPTWLGSVKSGIGHLKAGAGAAALVKAVLTLATGVVPPTLNAGPVDPELGLDDSPLRLPRYPVALRRPLVGVSAFGFGGTDFHAVLSSSDDTGESSVTAMWRAAARPLVVPDADGAWAPGVSAPEVRCFAGLDLATEVRLRRARHPDDAVASQARIVTVARAETDVQALDRAARLAVEGGTHAGGDVFRGAGSRPVVLLFPGQGAPTEGAWGLARRIPAAARVLARLAPLLRPIDELEVAAEAGDPLAVHALVFSVQVAVAEALGLAPTELIGHSLGGLAAAVAAGAWTPEELLPAVLERGRALADCPRGAMAAVPLDERAAAALAEERGLWITAINAPDQAVIGGPVEAVEALGGDAHLLGVARAYHTPMVAPAEDALRAALARTVAPRAGATVRSARTGEPVSDLPEDLARSVVQPVRFADAVARALATWPDALFVEVGPGRSLAALARRLGAEVVSVDDPRGPAVAAAALLAAGHPGFLRALPTTLAEITPGASARAAPAAEPAPTPAREATPPVDDVRAEVLRAVCEVTGYLPDQLADGDELEADLGIDSIRKMQILGALEQRFAFATPEGDLSLLATADLAFLVAHVERHRGTTLAREEPVPRGGLTMRARLARPDPGIRFAVPAGLDPAEALDRASHGAWARGPLPTDAGGAAVAAWWRCVDQEAGAPPQLDLDAVLVDPLPVEGSLPEGPVVLATGGLRGILRPCLRALGPLRARVVLLHRPGSPQDEGVAELEQAGCEILLAPGDVASVDDAWAAVELAMAVWGRLDVVVHAAGVLRDGPSDRVTPEDRRAVLAPKWEGALALIEATRDLPLSSFVTFSSLAAHTGNPGQAAYAAANAAMETVRHPLARTLHLAWGPWSGVGMAADPGLLRLLAARGAKPIDPELGAATLVRLLSADVEGVVLVSGDPPPPRGELGPLSVVRRDRLVFPLRLDPASPRLADHRVAGRPLVPAATWVCLLLEAAGRLAGHDTPLTVEGLEVLAPLFVDHVRDDVRLELRHIDGGFEARIAVGSTIVCHALVCPCAAPSRRAPPVPLHRAESAAGLYRPDLLFHGPAWQVLERVAEDGLAADLTAGRSAVDAVDGAHQVLAAWAGRTAGWLGLPVGAGRWVATGGAAVRIETSAVVNGRELLADVVALDADGTVVLRGEGVRMRAARDGVVDVG